MISRFLYQPNRGSRFPQKMFRDPYLVSPPVFLDRCVCARFSPDPQEEKEGKILVRVLFWEGKGAGERGQDGRGDVEHVEISSLLLLLFRPPSVSAS